MAPDDVSERLLCWQERRERGETPTPEELCADRPDLAGELRKRIAALRSMEKLIGVNGVSQSTVSAAGPTGTPAWDSVTVPGYEVLAEIDRGGMGVVYQARQTALDRLVALKMIRAGETATADQRDRFRREAEAVARLRHPNIVQIYDVGEAAGRPYFTMEYMDGGSLADRLGTPLPAAVAAELVRTLAAAVQVAHDAGVVHRDLKPANVLLGGAKVPNADLLFPKVSDFGLAKRLDAVDGPTVSGAVLGTPSYMAPEQAGGQSRSAGPAADIYALGAILYECLTGRPPFRGETALDTLEQVRSLEPVPPRRLQPKVPRDLETICLKCLQKDPRRRYASAQELADDLGRYLNGEPIRARPVSLFGRGVAWTRKRPAVAALTALVIAAFIGLLGLWAHFTAKLHHERNQAELQKQIAIGRQRDAERQKARAEALMQAACSTIDQNAWALVSRKGEVVKEVVAGGIVYNLARVNGLAAAMARQDTSLEPADRERLADQYATRAVALLDLARDGGYFTNPAMIDRMEADRDLESVRGRDDYRKFVRELRGRFAR